VAKKGGGVKKATLKVIGGFDCEPVVVTSRGRAGGPARRIGDCHVHIDWAQINAQPALPVATLYETLFHLTKREFKKGFEE
jgi:hypothetical protein